MLLAAKVRWLSATAQCFSLGSRNRKICLASQASSEGTKQAVSSSKQLPMLLTALLQQDLKPGHLQVKGQHPISHSTALLCAPQGLPSPNLPSLYSVNDKKITEVNLL